MHYMPRLFGGILATSLLAACASGSEQAAGERSSSAGNDDGVTELSLVLGTKGSPFYQTLACGARDKANELDVKLSVAAPEEFAAAPQIQVVDSVTAAHPDASMVVPTDTKALIQPLRTMSQQDIDVLTVDQTLANSSFVETEIVTNNLKGGQQAADALAKLIGHKGKVLVITQPPGSFAQDQRVKGFEKRLKKKYPNINYLGPEYQSNDPAKAAEIVNSTLAAHPDLAGIFATNGQGAIGTVTGLEQANAGGGKVNVVAYDAATAEVNALRNGDIQVLIAQKPYQEGRIAVDKATAIVTGKPVKSRIYSGIVTIRQGESRKIRKYEYSPDC